MSDSATISQQEMPRSSIGRLLRVLAVIVVVLIVLVVGFVLFVANYDWNAARPWISKRISAAIDRPFSIEGNLSVQWLRVLERDGERSWLPWPHVFAHAIQLGNPDWAKQPRMVTVEELAFAVSPWPLLANTVDIPAIRLTGTDVDIERIADGRHNWTFKLASGGAAWDVKLGDLVLEKGKIVVNDAIERATLMIEMTPLATPVGFDEVLKTEESASRSQSAQTIGENAARKFRDAAATAQGKRTRESNATRAYEFSWTASGKFRGVAVEGRGRSGGILDMQDVDDPFPLQARLRAGTTRIAFVGTLTNPSDLAALDLRMWISGKSMADLFPMTGVALPETPPFATEGHLSGELKPHASVFRYEEFTGRVGGSDLGGSLTYAEAEPRPKLTGSVHSKLLQMVDLAPLIGADEPRAAGTKDDAATPTAAAVDRMIPDAQFRPTRWKAMDADVAFTGASISHVKEWPIDAVETQIILDNGRLRLEPLRFGIAGGRVNSAIRLDGSKDPLRGQIEIDARGLELEQLLPVASKQATFGQVNVSIALAGRGNSVAALLGTSDGEAKFLVDDGAISKTLLETAGLNIGNILLAKLFGDRSVQINCAAAQFVASEGVMKSQAFLVDTDDALIDVSGSVDIGKETLDLTVRPQAKGLRVFSLRSPLYVKGTFRQPNVGVKKGPLLLRGAGAVILAVFAAPAAALVPLIATSKRADPNRCEALLAEMRGQGTAR